MTSAIKEMSELAAANTPSLKTHDTIAFANRNQISFEQAHDLIMRYGNDIQTLEIETARIRGFDGRSQ